jgi:hypothetical protein
MELACGFFVAASKWICNHLLGGRARFDTDIYTCDYAGDIAEFTDSSSFTDFTSFFSFANVCINRSCLIMGQQSSDV